MGSAKPQQIPRAGIGIMLQPVQPDGKEMVVTRIIEGGTAHLSNQVLPGDIIAMIDGSFIRGFDLSKVVSLLTGPEESTLRLGLRRQGKDVNVAMKRTRAWLPGPAKGLSSVEYPPATPPSLGPGGNVAVTNSRSLEPQPAIPPGGPSQVPSTSHQSQDLAQQEQRPQEQLALISSEFVNDPAAASATAAQFQLNAQLQLQQQMLLQQLLQQQRDFEGGSLDANHSGAAVDAGGGSIAGGRAMSSSASNAASGRRRSRVKEGMQTITGQPEFAHVSQEEIRAAHYLNISLDSLLAQQNQQQKKAPPHQELHARTQLQLQSRSLAPIEEVSFSQTSPITGGLLPL